MKQYYQGEDIPFLIPFSSEFQNANSFSEFSEIRVYVYTDGCLIQKLSTTEKPGYSKLVLNNNQLSGIIQSEYSSRFSPGAIFVEIVGIKSSELTYDIGKQAVGSIKKSFIKVEKLEGDISLLLSKNNVTFEESGSSESITVTISGTQDKSYSIQNLPSWLSVSNKTNNGFTLTAEATPDENNRNATLTVVLDSHPSIQAFLDVNQVGQWLSTFIFDVDIPQSAVGKSLKLFNIGTDPSFSSLGEARVDWEDDGTWETISNIPHSIPLTPAPPNPASGGTIDVPIGQDEFHIYQTAGTRTITVQTRNGTNSFRFATPTAPRNDGDFSSLPASDINTYVTKIRDINSEYILNGNFLFYGVKYGNFDSDFVLNCPNMEDYDYMFYYFGLADSSYGNYNINYDLRFPKNFFSAIAYKTKTTHTTRMYASSGFTTIIRPMLGFSTVLESVLEGWRGMPLVGNMWPQRTGALVLGTPIVEEFLDNELFWDNPHIWDYRGAFWFINDFYGQYPDTGFQYYLTGRADLFKYNIAQNIDISWMFRQANRMVIEVDFFRYIKDRLKKFNGIFWQAFNNGGNPRAGAARWIIKNAPPLGGEPGDTGSGDPNWINSKYNVDYRGATDLNLLFPDNSYPSVEEAVYSFGYRGGHGGTAPGGDKRSIANGVHHVLGDYGYSEWGYWRGREGWSNYLQSPISIQTFLTKFPNCTPTSGRRPLDGSSVDGFFGSFWDLDVVDDNNIPKASDYNNTTRDSVFAEANDIDTGLGNSVI